MNKEIEQRIAWINERVPLDGIQISYIKFQIQEHTKPLLDKITTLESKFEQSDKMYSNLLAKKDDFKLKWENAEEEIAELKQELDNFFEDRKKLIEEVAKLKASKSEANEWISVLLGLPNDGIEVSVRLDCAYNGNGIIEPKSSAKFNHSTKYWESGLSTLYSVTHWKPLI